MNDKDSHATDASRLFEDVVAEFLQAEELGQRPDPEQYLESFPDLADRLKPFFANRQWFDAQASKLAPPPAPPVSPAPPVATVSTVTATASTVDGRATASPLATRFAGYEILGELGRGGMGVVYQARQLNPDRLVALKVIRADRLAALSADERQQWIDRFRREARLVASLDQPAHIVTLYEVGEFAGQSYFTMRLIEGGSLAQHCARRRRKARNGRRPGAVHEQRANVRLLAQVARAIDYAHRRGILHRDLKPGNILLDRTGEPLVTDFGLARRFDDTGSLVQSGIEGSAPYMAPEQARAAPGAATTAADVYSLGAILYELLTGKPPFRGSSDIETLLLVLTTDPVPPRQVDRRLNRDLETICLTCLRKEPQSATHPRRRWPTTWRTGSPAVPSPSDPWARWDGSGAGAGASRRWPPHWELPRRRLIVGTVASSLFGFSWRRTAEDLDEQRIVAINAANKVAEAAEKLKAEVKAKEEQRKRAVDAQRETKHMAAGLLVNAGVQACAQGDLPLGMLQLARGLEGAPDDANLQEVVRMNLPAWRRMVPRPREPLAHPGAVAALGFSPDGRTLWALSTGTVRIEERAWGDGQKRMTRVFRPEMIGDPFFEGQGVSLFANAPRFPRPVTPRGRLLLWEMRTGKPVETTMPDSLQVLAVSPDMHFVLTARRQDKHWDLRTTVQVWDLTARTLVGQPVRLNDAVRFARFSPDSKVAVTAGEGGIAVWSAEKGELLQHVPSPPGRAGTAQLQYGWKVFGHSRGFRGGHARSPIHAAGARARQEGLGNA